MPQSRTDAPDHARQVGGLEDASGTAQAPGRRHGGEIKEKRGEDALFRQGPAQAAGIQRQAPACIPDSHQRAKIAGRPQGQGPLSGAELCLARAQDGQLFIRLACADPASFQTAVGAQDALRSALERSGENVRVEIVQSRADGGNEGDARQQSRGRQDYVPDVE